MSQAPLSTKSIPPLSVQRLEETQAVRPEHLRGPLEQSWIWGRFQGATAGRTHLGFYEIQLGGKVIGHVDLVEVKLRYYCYVWAKNGPSLDGSFRAWPRLTETLVELARQLSPSSQFLRLHLPVTEKLGYPAFGFHIQRTLIAQPLPNIDDFIATMPSAPGRNEARRALRDREIQVIKVRGDQVPQAQPQIQRFYQLWSSTSRQKGFGIHYQPYIEAMFKELGEACLLIVADIENQIQAGAIFTFFGPTATYYYAASAPGKSTTYAGMRCVLEGLMEAYRRGCTRFDLLGIESVSGDRLSGVTRFKKKFSEHTEMLLSVQDLPLRAWRYRLIRTLYRLFR